MGQLVLKKPKQWQVLFSPIRMDVVGHLELYGPGSIAEVARELGRTPHSLYHHFKKLVDAGILRIEETRRSGAREEAVYSVCGRPVIVRYEPDTARTRALRAKATAHILQQAARDYRRALEAPTLESEQPELRRYRMRLRPASVRKIRRHLDAIIDVILNERVPSVENTPDACWYTWVSMLAPQGTSSATSREA